MIPTQKPIEVSTLMKRICVRIADMPFLACMEIWRRTR